MNRGRFQAQGTQDGSGKRAKLEESEPWATTTAYHFCCGLHDLKKLKQKLTKSQLKLREKEFMKAEDEIIRCRNNGGVKASNYVPK